MRARPLSLTLDPGSRIPITLQIVEGLRAAIQQGRLVPGEPLPSTRTLAESLKVSRNTVLDAYDELASEGLVESRRGSGSFVREDPRTRRTFPAPQDPRSGLAFKLRPAAAACPPTRAVLSCLTGQADPRLLPAVALARSYRRALETRAVSMPVGRDLAHAERLREQLLEMLHHTAHLGGTHDNLLLTAGVSAALRLVAGALVSPGDGVAVETLGSLGHREILQQAGAVLVPVPVDADGMDVEALESLTSAQRPRAVLLTPRCQYPTTVVLSEARRERLFQWAESHQVALVELDTESGIHHQAVSPLPLAAEDRQGSCIYIGTFAKTLFPGLPLAHIHAPAAFIAHLAHRPDFLGQGADPVFEGAMTDLFVEGEFHRHLARLRTALQARRTALEEALAQHLDRAVTWRTPSMGMALWLEVASGVDVEAWATRALQKGVAFTPGRRYAWDGASIQGIRLGFASHQPEELQEIVRRMAAAL